MKVLTPIRVGGGIVAVLAVLWCWYMVAADYSYKAISGTYLYQGAGESCTLVLRQDQSFQQDLNRDGKFVHAQGAWRRIGEGGVAVSKEFLKVEDQEVRSDGQADGQIDKRFAGLFPAIRFEPQSSGPKFNRTLFR